MNLWKIVNILLEETPFYLPLLIQANACKSIKPEHLAAKIAEIQITVLLLSCWLTLTIRFLIKKKKNRDNYINVVLSGELKKVN